MCRTWEQLHAHDRYQNVTEHKTSGHNICMKQNLQICTIATQKVGQASYSSMHVIPGLYGCCMHTGLAHHVLCRMCLIEVALCWHVHRLVGHWLHRRPLSLQQFSCQSLDPAELLSVPPVWSLFLKQPQMPISSAELLSIPPAWLLCGQ